MNTNDARHAIAIPYDRLVERDGKKQFAVEPKLQLAPRQVHIDSAVIKHRFRGTDKFLREELIKIAVIPLATAKAFDINAHLFFRISHTPRLAHFTKEAKQ